MINEIKQNGDVIKKYLITEKNMTLSDMERETPLSRGQIRIAVAYLLGAEQIEEVIYGRSKVYFLENLK